MGESTCSFADCDGPFYAHGWCKKHYGQQRRLGQLPPRPTVEERFWAKVDKGDGSGCWLWTSTRSSGGYGMFWSGMTTVYPHRYAYELLVGPIPQGLQIDHLCRVRHCLRPSHLEPVTNRENCLRGNAPLVVGAWHRAKTHCPQGHEYTAENTYRNPQGRRSCRVCQRERQQQNRTPRRPKTHCVNGHEYTPENTTSNGCNRACRTCVRENARRRYHERKAGR